MLTHLPNGLLRRYFVGTSPLKTKNKFRKFLGDVIKHLEIIHIQAYNYDIFQGTRQDPRIYPPMLVVLLALP